MTAPLDRASVAAALAPGALLAAMLLGAALLLGATLAPAERATAWALLEPRLALVFLLWLVASLAAGTAARRLWLRHGSTAGRLAETVQVLRLAPPGRRIDAQGQPRGARALAEAVNALLAEREELLGAIDRRVAEAADGIAQERNRLGALMAELTQSVVVCNLDGRVLLFNARARLQFRALAEAAAHGSTDAHGSPIGGAEPLALGRSIYAALDRRLVAHALDSVQQRLARGAAHAAATFVTATRGGQLLRVQLAPVRALPASGEGTALDAVVLDGFVLMLDNVTHDLGAELQRDLALHRLVEGQRAALGNLRAAVELLDEPDLPAATRERFFGVVRDEIGTMTKRLHEATASGLQQARTRWPLEDMLGADLVAAAARRIEADGGPRVNTVDVDGTLWLRVDSYSLLQALSHLASRLSGEYGIGRVALRLSAAAPASDGRVWLDLVWPVQAMSTETITAWENEPIVAAGEATPLSVRDVLGRHGGTLWFERARVRQEAFFRLLLPSAGAPGQRHEPAHADSRPEFYDFELFRHGSAASAGWLERPLAELAYTVFDCETTGLLPASGDEIIQIGATRVVAGKLRRESVFEQLVDPQRSVPEAGIAIHGIRPEQLAGQPLIGAVLPVFHAFAADTVLVAHNAAFDMRFLQLKEAATGVRFEQPVLDSLLLSAVLHPEQESHRLEAIAERLGVPVLGRHTALGDAMVTAEVLVKMLPLLRERGLVTLGQVLEASRATWLARVQY
jgi:DNA polymerase-3 subunit epsilon